MAPALASPIFYRYNKFQRVQEGPTDGLTCLIHGCRDACCDHTTCRTRIRAYLCRNNSGRALEAGNVPASHEACTSSPSYKANFANYILLGCMVPFDP